MPKPVEFTEEKYEKLVLLYETAIAHKDTIIKFEDHEILPSYCKYLLEHLSKKFKNNGG